MSEDIRPPGKTTIAPDVLITIAQLTALSVKGVSYLSPKPGAVSGLFKRGQQGEGVRINVEDGRVMAEVFVVLERDVNILQVSREIQKEIARAIEDMVGMEVGHINVRIEDIDYSQQETSQAS